MRYFDRNHNENVDSESGNENCLRNSCSDRSLYDLFRIISEEDFQEENIYNIDLFLIYSRNRSDGSDGISGNGTVDTDSYFQDTKAITEVKKEYQKNVEKNGIDQWAYA